jgi:hypothetical protein
VQLFRIVWSCHELCSAGVHKFCDTMTTPKFTQSPSLSVSEKCSSAHCCMSLSDYIDDRNLNSFTASLHVQQSIKCSCTVRKEMFHGLQLYFPKAPMMKFPDLPKLCVDVTIF